MKKTFTNSSSLALTLTLIFSLTLFFAGCKKYDEGPCFSFRIPENRIKGNWDIKGFYINGNDSTEILLNTYGLIMYFNTYDAGDDNKFNAVGISGDVHHGLYGKWDFIDKKKKINIEFFLSNDSILSEIFGPLNEGIISEWEILKLFNDELRFKINYNSIEYELVLEKMDLD